MQAAMFWKALIYGYFDKCKGQWRIFSREKEKKNVTGCSEFLCGKSSDANSRRNVYLCTTGSLFCTAEIDKTWQTDSKKKIKKELYKQFLNIEA